MPAGTVTGLRAQVKDSKRVNVFLDGEFAIGISLDTLTREGLFVGRVLSEADYARLEAAESSDRAYHAALQFLTARPRSQREIQERLAKKGYAPEAVEAALERLVRAGLVDDAAFARFWVENRLACRPKGAVALRDELSRKGIDRNLTDALLADEDLLGDETLRARTLARAALSRYRDAPDQKTFQRRLGGYLQRRGFSYETLRPILDELWSELLTDRKECNHDDE